MSVGSIRGLLHQAECSSKLLVTPATTTAKGLSHRLPPQVHSLRHRRRRGAYSAFAEESATTAIRLYGALASAYLSEVPLLVSLRLRFYFWFYEGGGTCPPRPPVSIPGHQTLRGPLCCLRYSIDSKGFASLVDSSGRCVHPRYDAGLFLFSPFCRLCPLSCGNVVFATWSRLSGVGSPCTGQLCFFKHLFFSRG